MCWFTCYTVLPARGTDGNLQPPRYVQLVTCLCPLYGCFHTALLLNRRTLRHPTPSLPVLSASGVRQMIEFLSLVNCDRPDAKGVTIHTTLLPSYYPLTTQLLPTYYPATTQLLPSYYPAATHLLPSYYPAATQLLPSYYPLTTQLLPSCYPATSQLLPSCYPLTTQLLPTHNPVIIPSHYLFTTELLPSYYPSTIY